MPILPNSRHERFAQELAKGSSIGAAYAAAGFRPHDSNASRLSRNEHVRARVEELLAAGAEKAGVTVQRIVEELAKVGFANMQDYMRVGPDGDPVLDFSQLSRDQAAALAEVTVEDFKDGRGEDAREVRRVKFKLADKHLGMFNDKGPQGGEIRIILNGADAAL
jgi:phage terminase small subunit